MQGQPADRSLGRKERSVGGGSDGYSHLRGGHGGPACTPHTPPRRGQRAGGDLPRVASSGGVEGNMFIESTCQPLRVSWLIESLHPFP